MPPTTLHGENATIYPSASFSGDPFFSFMPRIALGEEEMGDVGHQQPSHIPDQDWGKGAAACMEMGTELTRDCGTLGMGTKAMVQSWPVKGRSPVPPQGGLSQDRGSPVGLGGPELGTPASPSPKNQPRQPKGI